MNYQGVANYLQVPVSSVAFYMTLVYLSIAIFAAPLGNIMERYNQRVVAVSYTHLDVYKRQMEDKALEMQ